MSSIEFLKTNERSRDAQTQQGKVSPDFAKNIKSPANELLFGGSGSAEEKNAFSIYRRENSDNFLSLTI